MIAPASKTCSSCGDPKPVTEFYVERRSGRRVARCKGCCVALATQWKQERRQRLLAMSPPVEAIEVPVDADPMALAVAAYHACRRHHDMNAGRERAEFMGPTAEQYTDPLADGWRGRITMLCRVLDMAKGD